MVPTPFFAFVRLPPALSLEPEVAFVGAFIGGDKRDDTAVSRGRVAGEEGDEFPASSSSSSSVGVPSSSSSLFSGVAAVTLAGDGLICVAFPPSFGFRFGEVGGDACPA